MTRTLSNAGNVTFSVGYLQQGNFAAVVAFVARLTVSPDHSMQAIDWPAGY